MPSPAPPLELPHPTLARTVEYRSVAQLSDQVLAWSRSLPRDLDLVVGAPRSGLLAANLVAVYRNIPLTDVDGLVEGRTIATGHWKRGSLNGVGGGAEAQERFLDRPRNVLVVDDTVGSGTSMAEAGDPWVPGSSRRDSGPRRRTPGAARRSRP